MTVVLDHAQPMSCNAQLEGGTMTFMPPELLVPAKFGMKGSSPMQEADVYAFGSVIFQVCAQDFGHCRLLMLFRSSQAKAHSVGFNGRTWATKRLRATPNQTREYPGYWVFRFTVGFRPTLLGWKYDIATEGCRSCDTP